MRAVLLIVVLLCAAPALADCLNLPIVGNGHDVPGKDEQSLPDDQGGYRPKIPATLIKFAPKLAQSYITIGWSGGPTKEGVTVVTCFKDSLTIPAALGPMTRDEAMQQVHDSNPTIKYNPDTLKIPEQSSLQKMLDYVWRVAKSYIEPALAWASVSTDNFNRADNSDLDGGGHAWDPYNNPSS